MVDKFKLIKLDFVSLVLTILAFITQNVGMFAGPWWTNENVVGISRFGMIAFTICEVSCIDRSILDIDGEREWVFAVRVFEVFGEICVILTLILAILTIVLRRRPINTALIYFHAAAAVFIFIGVCMFLGFHSTLNKNLDGESSLNFTFAFCLMSAIICTAASVVSAISLKTHLLNPIWEDDDDDDAQFGEIVHEDDAHFAEMEQSYEKSRGETDFGAVDANKEEPHFEKS